MTTTDAAALFDGLSQITARPEPFSVSTVDTLWTDPHISEQMLRYHLDEHLDSASRRQEFIDRSARWIVDTFALDSGKAVLDLGCGPGLYTNRLAAAGAEVTGIDFSPRSIDHARRTADEAGLEVHYLVADYLDDPPAGPFDLAMIIYCDLCVLPADQRARLLAHVRNRLRPGGALLFDVASLARFVSIEEGSEFAEDLMHGFWAPGPYFGFHTVHRYDAERVVLDRYDIIQPDRAWTVYNWLQHYDPDTLEAELRQAGFEVADLLGDVAGAEYDRQGDEFAVVARPVG